MKLKIFQIERFLKGCRHTIVKIRQAKQYMRVVINNIIDRTRDSFTGETDGFGLKSTQKVCVDETQNFPVTVTLAHQM